MLGNVQPVVPAAVQNQPRHQTVTGLTRAAVIRGKVVAPLLVVKQRVERIHVHVVTAGTPPTGQRYGGYAQRPGSAADQQPEP